MQELENNISNKYVRTLVHSDAQEDHKNLITVFKYRNKCKVFLSVWWADEKA